MKMFLIGALLGASVFSASCNTKQSRYIDPNTGEGLALEKDEASGLLVDTATGKPVAIYVDTETRDTVWGKTGKVINGKLRREKAEGDTYVYIYDEPVLQEATSGDNGDENSGAYEIKDGDYKKEVEKDGDIKIKDGNKKIKIDGETGERKVKYDDK